MNLLFAVLLAAFTVVQNGDQKIRREFTFDNPGPNVVRAEAIGDQHIVFKDAAGKPVKYYHTVTDTYVDADKLVPKRHFTKLAWGVVFGYFSIIVLMGWYFARKEKNANSFFKGGGKIPWYVAGVSIFATMLSSVTFLSVPSLSYISDMRLWQNVVLGYLIVSPIALIFYMPVFRRMNLTSAYEYLERRFNLGTRLFSSGIFVIFMVIRVAIVTLLPALAIDAVTGMGIDQAIAICGIVTVVYCSLGGLEAVIWSDFVQGLVLIGGAVAILVYLIVGTDGGVAGFLSLGSASGKLRIFDFRPEIADLTFWVALTLGVTQTLFSYTSDQCVVQRYIAVKDEKAAARSISINCVLSIVVCLVFFLIGAGLWTHFKCHPEMLDPLMPKNDSILPHFIGMELPPVIGGLVIAAVFAATISTLSANLSAASSAITTDFVARFRPLTDRAKVRLGQIFVIICGILGTGAAFALAHIDLRSLCDLFQETISTMTAGIAGIFFLGVFCKRVGGKAALTGLLVNYVVCFGFKFSGFYKVWGIHPFMIGGFGLVACIATGILLSTFTPLRRRSVHTTILISVICLNLSAFAGIYGFTYHGLGTPTDGVYRAWGPFAAGKTYMLTCLAKPVEQVAAPVQVGFGEFDTPNAGNCQFELIDGQWTRCNMTMRMADDPTAAQVARFGGWSTDSVHVKDSQVFKVEPRYGQFGGQLLGHDEWIDGDVYCHLMRLVAPVGNVSRTLVSYRNVYYNAYRWWLFTGGEIVYRYSLEGRAFQSAKLTVPCMHYTKGSVAVEISKDGEHWMSLGAVTRTEEFSFTLPWSIFPAKTIYVRYRAVGEASVQVQSALFEARVDGPKLRAFGRTELLSEDGKVLATCEPPLAAREDFGERLYGGVNGVQLWRASSGWKVMRTRCVPTKTAAAVRVATAANEAESVQLVVNSPRDLNDIRVHVSGLKSSEGKLLDPSAVSVRRVGYVKVTTPTDSLGTPGLWPDPLPPQDDSALNVPAGENQPFWITVKPPKGTPRGIYRSTLTVASKDGVMGATPFEVEVFGFELPDELTCKTAFGYRPERSIDMYHGVRTQAQREVLLDKYLAALGEHHLAPNHPAPYAPYTVTWKPSPDGDKAKAEPVIDWCAWDAATEKALKNCHFNAFRIPVLGLGPACLQDSGFEPEKGNVPQINGVPETDPAYDVLMRKYYSAVTSHLKAKGWIDKAYFYWFDEPTEADYPIVQKGMLKLKKYAPEVTRLLTEPLAKPLFGGNDLWVPTPAHFHSPYLAERRQAGDKFWWYVCCGPTAPFVGLFIDHPGVDLRTWLWQTWDEGLTGVLIWETTYWSAPELFAARPQNPYEDPMGWASRQGATKLPWGNGDGRFLYPPLAAADARPARPVVEPPVPSQRIVMLRDGLEDYEYFVILRRLLAERGNMLSTAERGEFERLLKIPRTVTRSLVDYAHEPDGMESHRQKLARAIERLVK